MTGPLLTRRDLRRRGWREWRAAVPTFVTPRRRLVLVVMAIAVGSAAAVATDRFIPGLDAVDWAGTVRVVGTVSAASLAAGLGIAGVVAVWIPRDRRQLPPVPWRDDRLVADWSTPGAPALSATLAPRLLASARKQRVELVGSLTLLVGLAAAFAVGLAGVTVLTVAAGFPGFGFAGAALSVLSLPFTTAATLEGLGRAAVAIEVARAHPGAQEAPVSSADR